MHTQAFSLVELLVVIGIIVLLAGLTIPAVQSSKTRGQITQAKADMSAIKMALLGVERDYKTIFKLNSSYNVTGGDIAETANFGGLKVVRYNEDNVAKYNALIKELSIPREFVKDESGTLNFNTRNIKYLDPRADYDKDNPDTIWRDPWGSPYVIIVCTDGSDKVYIPYESSKVTNPPKNVTSNKLILRGKVFVYSYGPNGEDDGSFNSDNGGSSKTDDVRGWEK